jgi:hypothetical protein
MIAGGDDNKPTPLPPINVFDCPSRERLPRPRETVAVAPAVVDIQQTASTAPPKRIATLLIQCATIAKLQAQPEASHFA